MITPAYVQTMARYNTWQNNALMRIVEGMDQAELDLDRGAFFGSIQGTLSHLLWGDQLWLSRFDSANDGPACPAAEHATHWGSKAHWATDRFVTDGRLRIWAEGLRQIDLSGQLSWRSETMQRDFEQSLAFCIMQFFNHQTHHRGQVHAMLTAAGQEAPVSDLIFLPEDA